LFSGWIDECASGAWFSGWSSPVRRPAGDAPVAPPETWLLATGWRKRAGGPIRRDEVPA
jgi:hypothetical protein